MKSGHRQTPEALLGEAASLLHLMGGMGSRHMVIVGGMVPPLLVPAAAHTHVGSADIDLFISVAMTDGMTRQYAKSIQEIIAPHFEPASSSGHRWRKRDGVPGLPLIVDFLASKTEETLTAADGTLEVESDTADQNLGIQLAPFAIRAGRLIDEDAELITVEDVDLLYSRAVADVDVRHAGPVGLLAAKADALYDRNESKDGYDVAWWCLNAAPDPSAVADLVMARPGFKDELFPETVAILKRAFKTPAAPGPHGYATELLPDNEPGDNVYDIACNEAFAVVSRVIEILAKNLWD